VNSLKQRAETVTFDLVVSDYLTKWTEAFALPDIEAETIARTIMKHVVGKFGVPAVIYSD
jgi:hypothetical protein